MSQRLYGRVLLWQQDIEECRRLMKMGERCYESLNRARDVPIDKTLAADWARLSDEQVRELGIQCESTCPDAIEFPRQIGERGDVYHALEMLAVVTLMRIWSQGFAQEGIAEGNFTAQAKAMRERLVALAFPEPADRAQFDDLLGKLKAARDQAIAHADAEPRDIRFHDGFVSYGSATNIMNTIDVYVMIPCLEKLRDAARIALEEAAQAPDGVLGWCA
jgi:hypothetical protein